MRVTAPTLGIAGYTGTLRSLAPDSMIVVDTLRLSPAAVTRLQVHRQPGSLAVAGALTGLLVGTGAGAVAGMFGSLEYNACYQETHCPLIWAAFIGLPAAGLGALAGAGLNGPRRVGNAALLGFLLGAGSGVAAGTMLGSDECQPDCRLWGIGLFGAAGTVIGTMFGLGSRGSWRDVDVADLRLTIVSKDRRVGIGVVVDF